jgi:ankyrin repeat protein
LLRAGSNASQKNNHGLTAIHLAALRGNGQIIQVAAHDGLNLNLLDDSQGTPLHTASMLDDTNMARELLAAGCKLDCQNQDGDTALHLAVRDRSEHLMNIFIQAKASTTIPNSHGDVAFTELPEEYTNLTVRLAVFGPRYRAVKDSAQARLRWGLKQGSQIPLPKYR